MNDEAGGVLARIDAAIDQKCGCLCGKPITDQSPTMYFATERCQDLWHARRYTAWHLKDVEQAYPARRPLPHTAGWLHTVERFTSAMRALMNALTEALRPIADALREFTRRFYQAAPSMKGPPTPPVWLQRPARPPQQIDPPHGWHTHAVPPPLHRRRI